MEENVVLLGLVDNNIEFDMLKQLLDDNNIPVLR